MTDMIARGMASTAIKKTDGFKDYVDKTIEDKFKTLNVMSYKGTVGIDGTVTNLPTEGVSSGDCYKVITDGIYAGQQAFIGDMFIAIVSVQENSIEWTLTPSGDDVNAIDIESSDNSISITKTIDESKISYDLKILIDGGTY